MLFNSIVDLVYESSCSELLGFCPQMPREVFQHYPLLHGPGMSLLPPSQRLRMLLSLVSDDLPGAVGSKGPGLKLEQWKKPKFYNCASSSLLTSIPKTDFYSYICCISIIYLL